MARPLDYYRQLFPPKPPVFRGVRPVVTVVGGTPAPDDEEDDVVATALSSVQPWLGDTVAGTPMVLAVAGTIDTVTVGGVAATSLVQSGSTVYCKAPALAEGVYDVTVSGPGGEATLAGAYEAWKPSTGITSATPRVYDYTVGVSSSGNRATAVADQGAGSQTATASGTGPVVTTTSFGENDKAGLTFEASDNAGAGNVLNLASPISAPTAFSRFWVAKHIIARYNVNDSGDVAGGTAAAIFSTGYDNTAGKIRVFDADNGNVHRFGSEYHDGAARVHGVTVNGVTGALRAYSDGELVGSASNATFGNTRVNFSRIGTGSGTPYRGEMACLVEVEAVLSDDEVEKLSQWMYSKFVARSYAPHVTVINTSWTARDGAMILALGTDLYLLGGWNNLVLFDGGTKRDTNEIWKSTDYGATWTQVLAGDYTYHPTTYGSCNPAVRWTPRHWMGVLVHDSKMFVLGSDSFNGPSGYYAGNGPGTADVWSSPDGATWTLVTASAGWGARILHMVGVLNGVMYAMGGQTDLNDASTCLRDVWKSEDSGATWTRIADAPWAARGLVASPLPVFNGKLWVIAGGKYDDDGGSRVYYNDVWSFDGTTWTEVLADGHSQFSKRQYAQTLAWDGKLWLINGGDSAGNNIGDIWTSTDGATWTRQTITPWRASHADGAFAMTDRIILGAGNGDIGQVTAAGYGNVYRIVRNGAEP